MKSLNELHEESLQGTLEVISAMVKISEDRFRIPRLDAILWKVLDLAEMVQKEQHPEKFAETPWTVEVVCMMAPAFKAIREANSAPEEGGPWIATPLDKGNS